ncbi:uncharacterized protein LOC127855218 [Dreissena polymorpha]|uniref:uncharacterized protein LOC127855218 n=1 Tax=Dreissena polymorpha TaxID=45954 RepID=UPI0022640614|nr:uncharacterized protein LOC127855218 [Dreissena polymorpha]
MSGDLLNKLYEDQRGFDTVFKCAVSSSGDKIFVLNRFQHKVLTLARDGTVLHTFTDPDLEFPWGVHVTALGQVLICGSASLTILQLDSEGKKKLETLVTERDEIHQPCSVYYNRITSSIIVGQWYRNNIHVFQVK